MTLRESQSAFAKNVSKLIAYIFKQNFLCTFGEAYRTKEQALIYEQRGIGIKNSQHCKRLAVDLYLFDQYGTYLTKKSDYQSFGDYWKTLDPNNRWGGDFPRVDCVHFEMKD